MSSSTPPWKIDEISDEAQEAALNAAAASGISVGEWLTQLIREAAAPDQTKLSDSERLTSIERAMLRTRTSQN